MWTSSKLECDTNFLSRLELIGNTHHAIRATEQSTRRKRSGVLLLGFEASTWRELCQDRGTFLRSHCKFLAEPTTLTRILYLLCLLDFHQHPLDSETMGVSEFLDYIERDCPQALQQVDLGQLARKRLTGPGRRGRALVGQDPLYLVIDADSCLHRLYGGSFTDWVCGGQWNNMFHFVDNLARTCRGNNIKLIVFFNGSLERGRINDWIKFQSMARNTALQVLHHVHNKGTPPPKVLFTPPVCLGECYCNTKLLFWHNKPCTTSLFLYRELWQLCMCYTVLCIGDCSLCHSRGAFVCV